MSQEALLFERAEADSLTALERQVFFKSRILNYGEEDQLSGVSWCSKYLAWLFVIVYALAMSFYVGLFAVKAGRATSVQWMVSFWVAFIEVRDDPRPTVPPTGLQTKNMSALFPSSRFVVNYLYAVYSIKCHLPVANYSDSDSGCAFKAAGGMRARSTECCERPPQGRLEAVGNVRFLFCVWRIRIKIFIQNFR